MDQDRRIAAHAVPQIETYAMVRMLLVAILLCTFFVRAESALAQEGPELCQVGLVDSLRNESFQRLEGPLTNCKQGDVVRFQIDRTKVPYGMVAARYCDLRQTVVVEEYHSTVHLACVYQFKWAKHSVIAVHPDDKTQ